MLTNEEKINLRERALRLAHEFPIENTGTYQSWADDIYDYLTKDIDLAEIPELEKSRSKLNGSDVDFLEWVYLRMIQVHGELGNVDYMIKFRSVLDSMKMQEISEKTMEIDWSRPHLVRSIDLNCIVEVLPSDQGGEKFTGKLVKGPSYCRSVGMVYDWVKASFVYYGEIPQEQKADGLNFLEAIKAAKRGKNIRRARNWAHGYFWYHSNDTMYDSDGDRIDSVNPSNILATDWQIVE